MLVFSSPLCSSPLPLSSLTSSLSHFALSSVHLTLSLSLLPFLFSFLTPFSISLSLSRLYLFQNHLSFCTPFPFPLISLTPFLYLALLTHPYYLYSLSHLSFPFHLLISSLAHIFFLSFFFSSPFLPHFNISKRNLFSGLIFSYFFSLFLFVLRSPLHYLLPFQIPPPSPYFLHKLSSPSTSSTSSLISLSFHLFLSQFVFFSFFCFLYIFCSVSLIDE